METVNELERAADFAKLPTVDEIVRKQLSLLHLAAEAATPSELLTITKSMAELLSAANMQEKSKKDAPAAVKV